MKKLSTLVAAALLGVFMGASAANADEVRPGRSTGLEGRYIGGNQLIQLSEEVTQRMLSSDAFLRIMEDYQRPRLVVDRVFNRTQDELLPVVDVQNRISEVVIEANLVRWFEYGTNDFDLVVRPVLTRSTVTNGRRSEYTYTLTLTLSDALGEVRGRWTATRAYVQ